LFGVIRFGKAELDVGMAENCPSRVGALSGEKGRLGRYEYAEEVSGRLRYLVSDASHDVLEKTYSQIGNGR
jgi:hypothetical protein